MNNFALNRREAMQTAAGSVLGLSLLSGVSSAETLDAQSVDGRTVYIGTGSALYGLDAATGETIVEAGLEEITWSSPTVVDGTAYIGDQGDDDDDATVYAIDATTGDVEWTFTDPGDWVWSSPTVVDGVVYIGEGGAFETEDWDYSVFAIDAETGEEIWSFDAATQSESSPNVVGGVVYVGFENGTVQAIDAETGQEIWTYNTGEDSIHSSPTTYDGTVYFGSAFDGGLYAVDAESGDEVWTFEDIASVDSSPTVVDGTVYIGEGAFDDPGGLYAVDAATGEIKWTFTDPEEEVKSSPTVYAGTVYVGSDDGTLYAVDADSGEEAWTFETDGEIESSPTAYDGTVYVGSDDGNLYALDAETGQEEWSSAPGITIRSSPTVVNDPQDGHSVGTRVELGTLGHHHVWNETATDDSDTAVDTTLTLDNVGTSVWEVTDINGENATAPIGEENPTIDVERGGRYRIENNGWSAHPLAFEAADGTVLLSQDGEGSYEADESVDWVDDNETVEFTLTESLANELTTYVCTVHGSMEGSIESITEEPDEPAEEHESGVDQELFEAVDQSGDGDVSLGDLQDAVEDWSTNQQIDGVEASLDDLRAIVDWWAS